MFKNLKRAPSLRKSKEKETTSKKTDGGHKYDNRIGDAPSQNLQASTEQQQQQTTTNGLNLSKTLPSVPLPEAALSNIQGKSSQQASTSKDIAEKRKDVRERRKPALLYIRSSARPSTSASENLVPSILAASPSASTVAAHPFQNVHANASVASEAWAAPEDADGAYVRRTYAHFDARGVRGDGVWEGKEWTRERGPRAAWEVSSADGSTLPRDRRLSMPPATHAFTLKDNHASDAAVLTNVSVQKQNGRLSPIPAPIHVETAQGDRPPRPSDLSIPTTQQPSRPSSPRIVTPGSIEVLESPAVPLDGSVEHHGVGLHHLGASTSSLGSHSEDSLSGPITTLKLTQEDAIDIERKQLMTKVDRYGFFSRDEDAASSTTRSRMTILPPATLQQIPRKRLNPLLPHGSNHRNGLRSNPSRDFTGGDEAQLEKSRSEVETGDPLKARANVLQEIIRARNAKELALREREALRERKWDRMLIIQRNAADSRPTFAIAPHREKTSKFRRRVYKGVPDRWRAAVWWAMLHAASGSGDAQVSSSDLPPPAASYEETYAQLLRRPSAHDVQIDLDVPRTISGHILFHTRYGQGQRALFHVLHAFSLLCTDCAYCQGMGPIAATLLVYFEPAKTYAVLEELHRRPMYGLHQTFSPGFPGLVENFYAQRRLARHLCPDVMKNMEENGIVTSAYATKWYITLFTNVFPFAAQLRLWDAYFLHGKDVLVVTAVAILWCLRAELMHGNFETCLNLLSSELVPVDDDMLLNWIYLILLRDDVRKCLATARKEWTALVQRGDELPML